MPSAAVAQARMGSEMKRVCSSGIAAMALALAGCAGPVETVAGSTGTVPPRLAVAIVSAPDLNGPAAVQARVAVAQALTGQGYVIDPNAQALVTVGLAERDAVVAIGAPAGGISAGKKQRLLQNCADRTQRLTLAFYAGPDAEPVRAFAEEHHCSAALAESLPSLAARAVDGLLHPGDPRITYRFSRD